MIYYKIVLLAVYTTITSDIYADNVSQRYLKKRQSSTNHPSHTDCGRLPTSYNDEDTEEFYGSIPWSIGIYRKNNDNYRIICGGTLIASNLVVSAAQCFWQEGLKTNTLRNINDYKVIIGKYEQNNMIIDDEFTQTIDIELIYLNKDFYGLSKYYDNDIAVIVLSVNIKISDNVMPVCIDWTKQHNTPLGPGKTVGLGETESRIPSSVMYLSYITRLRCQSKYKNGFALYVTADKFCADPQSRDDGKKVVVGAGLVFMYHKNLHFLIGVASVKDPDPADTITAFTNVKQHIPWIRSIYKIHTGVDPITSSTNLPNTQLQTRHKCVIPTSETHAYFVNDGSILAPGSEFDSYRGEVNVTCKEGYTKLLNNDRIFCSNDGKWYPEGFEKLCLKRCQPIVSEGMILKYTYNGERVDGSNPVLPGTRVKPECNTISHKLQNPEAYRPKVLICLSNGIWNDKIYFECAPICGVFITGSDQSVSKKPDNYYMAPWNVGVYRKYDTLDLDHQLVCGGTLVSQHLVLSAAHCVDPSNNLKLFKIGIGKYTSNISVTDYEFTKIFDVKDIHVHVEYSNSTFINDIAVIVLLKNVEFSSTSVMPVCMDWTGDYSNIPINTDGQVAYWEKTDTGFSSAGFKVAHLPYIERKTCLDDFNKDYVNLVWIDKICAGRLIETDQSVRNIINGAGLTSIRRNKLQYLTGISCLNDPTSQQNSITIFTEIKYHMTWLNEMHERYT